MIAALTRSEAGDRGSLQSWLALNSGRNAIQADLTARTGARRRARKLIDTKAPSQSAEIKSKHRRFSATPDLQPQRGRAFAMLGSGSPENFALLRKA